MIPFKYNKKSIETKILRLTTTRTERDNRSGAATPFTKKADTVTCADIGIC